MPRVDLPVADGGEVQPVVAPGQVPHAAVVSAQYGQLLVEQRREYDDVLRDSNPNNREGKKLIYGLRALLATMAKMYEGRQGGTKGLGCGLGRSPRPALPPAGGPNVTPSHTFTPSPTTPLNVTPKRTFPPSPATTAMRCPVGLYLTSVLLTSSRGAGVPWGG